MSSVCVLVCTVSVTVVTPSAFIPASRTALLTCADGDDGTKSIPFKLPPLTVSGHLSPSICAPIFISGCTVERMLREQSDRSPTNFTTLFRPEATPISSLAVVAELPASITQSQNFFLLTIIFPPSIDKSAKLDTQLNVETVSPHIRGLITVVFPSAIAPNIAARIVILLSGGGVSIILNCFNDFIFIYFSIFGQTLPCSK